jgi:hypothetical protein
MSTTIHRPVPQHLGWYAVAALLAGAVLALIILVLQSTGSTAPPNTIVNHAAHYPHFPTVGCLAGHAVPNPELPRCIKPVG